jgi:hypothetical protein
MKKTLLIFVIIMALLSGVGYFTGWYKDLFKDANGRPVIK